MIITDQVAIVTGAASGIGKAISARLIKQGVRQLAMVDLDQAVERTAADLNQQTGSVIAQAFTGSVADAVFRRRVFDQISDHQPVGICVPAAGIMRDALAVKINRETGQAEQYPDDLFRQVLEINLVHPVYWSIEMIARIAESRAAQGLKKWRADEPLQGSIVLIGSVSSRGNRGQISYSCAKAGLNAATTTLMAEGMFNGVQTKIIHPGFVDTPMVAEMPEGYFEQHIKPHVQLGRLIKPEEIARAVTDMIENPIISGQIWADGGLA